MALATGNPLHALKWTELPIVNCIIDIFEETERSDNQPIMTNGYPILEWDPGVPIHNND